MDQEQVSNKTDNQSFDVKKYLLKAIAYWYLFVLSFIIVFGYKNISDRYKVNMYSTYATVILKDELQSTQRVVGGLQLFDNRKNIENEIGVLKSYSITEQALKELDFEISYFKYEQFSSDVDLYQNTPFIVIPDSGKNFLNGVKCFLSFIDENSFRIKIEDFGIDEKLSFGEHFKSDNFNFKIVKNTGKQIDYNSLAGQEYYFYKNSVSLLIKDYSNRLNVDVRSSNSSILWLWIDGTVPLRINNYLNKIIEIYLRNRLDEKNRIVVNTIKFIDKQLSSVVDSIAETEDSLQLFKQSNQILDIGKEGEMLFNDLAALQEELKMLKLKKNFYQYLETNISQDAETPEVISPALLNIDDPILTSYINEYQKLKAQAEILKYDVKSDVPSYDIIKLQIKKLYENITKHIATSVRATDYSIDEINHKIQAINAKLRRIPSVERQIKNIQRRYHLHDNIYSFLLERRTEAGITMASNSPGAKILDRARAENITRSSQSQQSSAKYFLIALLIPVLIIVGIDFFNNKIIDKSEIEKATGIPIVGAISKNVKSHKIPVKEYTKSPITEAFRSLKFQLNFLLKNKEQAVILISSALSGEGKSFISANLAALLAKADKKTVIIGLDLRKPTVHIAFGISHKIGVSSYLTNYNSLEEIIFETSIKNLYLIPSGEIPPNPAELIESPEMEELINSLKTQFDYIIIDTPPIAYVADTFILAKYADVNLFVIRQAYSPKNILKILDEIYVNQRVKNMGIVFNDVNQSVIYGLKKGYGFNYGFSHGYGYSDGQGYYEDVDKKTNIFDRFRLWFYSKLKKLFG